MDALELPGNRRRTGRPLIWPVLLPPRAEKKRAHTSTEGTRFIGWSPSVRRRHLHLLAYNTRFLILPWVEVPHLASHILGRLARQISTDWEAVYKHPVHYLETFVDRERFKGTCYRAANWLALGQTTGRGIKEKTHKVTRSLKDVLGYPLRRDFREKLCEEGEVPPACSRPEGLPALAREAREQAGRAGR